MRLSSWSVGCINLIIVLACIYWTKRPNQRPWIGFRAPFELKYCRHTVVSSVTYIHTFCWLNCSYMPWSLRDWTRCHTKDSKCNISRHQRNILWVCRIGTCILSSCAVQVFRCPWVTFDWGALIAQSLVWKIHAQCNMAALQPRHPQKHKYPELTIEAEMHLYPD